MRRPIMLVYCVDLLLTVERKYKVHTGITTLEALDIPNRQRACYPLLLMNATKIGNSRRSVEMLVPTRLPTSGSQRCFCLLRAYLVFLSLLCLC